MTAHVLLVAAGGAAGSACRYLVGVTIARALGERFPFATLAVNIIGCFAAGVLASAWLGAQPAQHPARLLLMTGLLGGFTTFSAFGLDTFALFQRGQTLAALTNIGLSVGGGLAAIVAGFRVGRVL